MCEIKSEVTFSYVTTYEETEPYCDHLTKPKMSLTGNLDNC